VKASRFALRVSRLTLLFDDDVRPLTGVEEVCCIPAAYRYFEAVRRAEISEGATSPRIAEAFTDRDIATVKADIDAVELAVAPVE
jgi:hypothetical protein